MKTLTNLLLTKAVQISSWLHSCKYLCKIKHWQNRRTGHAVQKTTQRCLGTQKWVHYVQGNMPKVVLKVPSEELFVAILDITYFNVVDEGRTQCPPGTVTAIGYDPLFDTEIR